jgi:hypothetical protein
VEDALKTATKIWLGVGAFVVAGAGAVSAQPNADGANVAGGPMPIDAQAPASLHTDTSAIVLAQAMKHGGEAGEAGEGGEKGAAKLPPDLAFAVHIGELRGHLLVGNQLIQQKQWKAALPHFLHPTEEIYGEIRDQLKDYGVPPFEAALKLLASTVKQKKGGADYDNARKAVEDALAKADAGLKAKQSNWAGFTLESAVELIKTAGGEYEEAIVKGRVAKPVEYQDARGFIWHADALIGSVAADLEKKNAKALQQVRAQIGELKKVFPTAMPPKKPVKSHAELLAIVSKLELASGSLM